LTYRPSSGTDGASINKTYIPGLPYHLSEFLCLAQGKTANVAALCVIDLRGHGSSLETLFFASAIDIIPSREFSSSRRRQKKRAWYSS
jgi:hypothetical protein